MDSLFPREHAIEPLDGDKGRTERGAFYTPAALALAICKTLKDNVIAEPRSIFEPGCGGGAFLRAAVSTWPRCLSVMGVDLAPACDGPGIVHKADLFSIEDHFSLVLGNPDFAIAEAVVRHCMKQLAPGGFLAFLLRAAFLGSAGRVPLYREYPLRFFQPVAHRPSFTTDGKTDPMEYGLFVWMDGHHGHGTILPPLEWR